MSQVKHYLTETVELVEAKQEDKTWYIEGVFMQADVVNRNRRKYPLPVLESAVNKYINERVKTRRSFGELNHPPEPYPNPERASHLITEIWKEGSDFYGKAKILNTPMGNIVAGLLEGGVQIGVSSRGLGTLKSVNGINEIQGDFEMTTVDIVSDPSAPDAFVTGLMEGREWVVVNIGEQQAEEAKRELEKKRINEIELMRKLFKSLVG